MSIIKNPVIIGIFVGVIVYLYLSKYHNKSKDNKKEEEVNIYIPVLVGVLTSFLSYCYFNTGDETPTKKYRFATDNSLIESDDASSYHLISKGVSIPTNVPDVNIDSYDG
jgi:hypothetical protein